MFQTLILVFGVTLFRFSSSDFCNKPLGLEDGTIPSEKLTASSEYSPAHGAHLARLNGNRGWACLTNNQEQWIQVEFSSPLRVTGLITQGRADLSQWVTSYEVHYSLDGDNFRTIMNAGEVAVFNGNSDSNTAVTNMFQVAVHAKCIQIHATDWNSRISLRFEVLGCSALSTIYDIYSRADRNKSPADAYVIKSVLAVSSGACSLECGRQGSCVSFSFIRSSNECILSTSTGQSAELEGVENTDFYVVM